jgi:hypothetical protein
MKKQIKTMLLLIATSFIIFSGCKKDDDSLRPVHMYFAGKAVGVLVQGTFTSTKGLVTSGTYTMDVVHTGINTIHCTTTCVTDKGSFQTLSDCELVNSTGVWDIVNGKGAYEDLQGHGTLLMMVSKDGFKVETLDGNIH